MKVLLSVFEKSKGPGSLLLVEDGKILDRIRHNVNFRGLTKVEDGYFVIDKKGTIFYITIKNNKINIEDSYYIYGIEDAHDLYYYDEGFITSCTANNYAADVSGNIFRPFLVDESILLNLKTNNQDLYHLNSFAPYKDGFLLSVFTDIPFSDNSRWRDRNTRGAIIYWNRYGFQEILAKNLSQPHSIRVLQDNVVYFCNSRNSSVHEVFSDWSKKIKPTGFIRGMDFYKEKMIIGHSKSRVMDAGQCGYSVVGETFFNLKGDFKEVYDLLVIGEDK